MFRKAPEAREKRESWTDKLINKGIPLHGALFGGALGFKAGGPQGALAGAQAGYGAGESVAGLIQGDEYSKARMTQGLTGALKGAKAVEESMRVGPQAGGEGTKVPTAEPFKAPKPTVAAAAPTVQAPEPTVSPEGSYTSSRASRFAGMGDEEMQRLKRLLEKEGEFGSQFGGKF